MSSAVTKNSSQSKKNTPDKKTKKMIAKNKNARHEYEILETFEAGLVLSGTEVKSLRERNCQITDSFCLIRNNECWLHGVHIHPYTNGSIFNRDPDRKRKLLLHKNQIIYLNRELTKRGMALIPLEIYFDEHNRVKLVIGLSRGKKLYDKRQDMAERDVKRDIARAVKLINQR